MSDSTCEVCRGATVEDVPAVYLDAGMVCEQHDDAVRRAVALACLSRQIDAEHLHAPVEHLHPNLASWRATEGKGVYLYGEPGTGKTDNASILTRKAFMQLWRSGGRVPSVVWLPVTHGIERIKGGFRGGPNVFDARTLWSVDLLVLDDIGMEQVTDWSRSLLYTTINERMVRRLVTIYTSNLDPAVLAARLSAPPLASRIAGTCRQIELTGPDWRTEK